jgi:Protein of unknown function (DUF1207)
LRIALIPQLRRAVSLDLWIPTNTCPLLPANATLIVMNRAIFCGSIPFVVASSRAHWVTVIVAIGRRRWVPLALLVALVLAHDEARADDAFIAGYATALLERELPTGSFGVDVVDRHVRVALEPGTSVEPGQLEALLGEVEGVTSVVVVESSPEEVAPAADTSQRGIAILPADELFGALLADPRWPRFEVGYQRYLASDVLGDVAAANFGETFALVRGPLSSQTNWEFGIQGGTFSVFDLNAPSTDLVNTDFLGGVYGSLRRGPFAGFLRVFHESSHLGDEFLLRTRPDRVNLSFEEADLLGSVNVTHWFRLYGGGGYIFLREPSDLRPGVLQTGAELTSPNAYWGRHLRPLAAVDLQFREESEWRTDVSARAGVRIESAALSRMQLLFTLQYYRGRSPNGQFYDSPIEFLGVGAQLGF